MLAPKNLKYESCKTIKEFEWEVSKRRSLYRLLALLRHMSNKLGRTHLRHTCLHVHVDPALCLPYLLE